MAKWFNPFHKSRNTNLSKLVARPFGTYLGDVSLKVAMDSLENTRILACERVEMNVLGRVWVPVRAPVETLCHEGV